MKNSQRVDKLAKFLDYLLGRQPDEFGLVPDSDGYVKIKDLLKALGEEIGWRHVRLNHLHELIQTSRSPQIEIEDNRIRAVDRSCLLSPEAPDILPKLLYYPIRRRAHPVVLDTGIPPDTTGSRITMAVDLPMARRLGRRIDSDPVILTVNSAHALKSGATIWRFGNQLFLSDRLPPGSFSGPPLPKKRPDTNTTEKSDRQYELRTPGSYLMDLTEMPNSGNRSKRAQRPQKNEWKRERKRKSRRGGFDWGDG